MKKITLILLILTATFTNSQAVLVKDIETSSLSSMPTYNFNRVDYNGQLIFSAYNSNTDDYHVWSTDGSTSGTKLLKTLVDYPSSPTQYFTYSSALNKVFFGAIETFNGTQSFLYSSDGTTTNTNKINASTTNIREITNFNGGVIFGANNGLAFYNGIGIINVSNYGAITEIKAIGNKVYFAAYAFLNEGNEICVTDGTAAGTYRIKDINPSGSGIINSDPKDFIGFNNKVYFTANNGPNGRELWVTDGTEVNTMMVVDLHPGNNPSFYQDPDFTIYKNELYFTAFTPTTGVEPFKIDLNGNVSNVADINPGATNHSNPKGYFVYNDKLYFSADDGINGVELWEINKTSGNTNKSSSKLTTSINLLKNINTTASNSSNPSSFIEFQGKMYFTADDGVNGKELWESDGTAAGTILKQNINPSGDSNTRDYIVSNNLLYFSADDGTNGDELWKFSNDLIVANLEPADDKIDVAIDSRLTITFNKNIIANTGSVTIYDASDDSVVETISITSSSVSITGNELLIEPSADFSIGQQYYVQIDNGAIKDSDNNLFAGVSNKTAWNFETIVIQNQTITFNPLPNKTYGDAGFSLTATASSNLPVICTSSNTNVATINGNVVTIIGAGTTTITASQAGDANFNPAADVSQTLMVNKSNQTITLNPISNKTYGDADFNLTAIASSNLAVTFTSSNTNVATINGNIVTIIGVGTLTITASQAGDSNYNPSSISSTITVNKANQTITFNPLPDKTFGDADFQLSATASSNLGVTYSSSNTNVVTISGNIATIIGAGSITITANQNGDVNYNSASLVSQILNVNKADQTITFGALADVDVNDANFNLNAVSSSGLPIVYVSSNPSIASLTGNVVSINTIGTTTITATQLGNINYNAASDVSQSLIVTSNLSASDFEKSAFNIYPNPTKNNFRIATEKIITNVSVYDMQGKTVKSFKENLAFYDVNDLTSGLYFVNIETDNGTTTKKLIKE